MNTKKLPQIPCSHCKGKGQVPDLSQIGRDLRDLRETAGVKGTSVAAAMGIATSTLHDMEAGRRGQWTDEKVKQFKKAVASMKKIAAMKAKQKAAR